MSFQDSESSECVLFWFRRDLRLHQNHGLFKALTSGVPVIPFFVFDRNILDELPADDRRVTFLHQTLSELQKELKSAGGDLHVFYGQPDEVISKLAAQFKPKALYVNEDYEPYAIQRDKKIRNLLEQQGVGYHSFKDQVIFNGDELLKADGTPYTVYTPYSKKWLTKLETEGLPSYPSEENLNALSKTKAAPVPSLSDMGFNTVDFDFPKPHVASDVIEQYGELRDFPAKDATSHLGLHLRFGTVCVRALVEKARNYGEIWLKQLIWREFFMSILYHFPRVVTTSFHEKYDRIKWENNPEHFKAWCEGKTGYPIVDAGMRELKATGYMHNRVRMITASFLTKHLLIDWRKGEAWFASHLLDYELASNNGSWQWAAGTGCDAAPYFRVFNPALQTEKFDPKGEYIRKWVPELEEMNQYPHPVVEHKFARQRAIDRYAEAVKK